MLKGRWLKSCAALVVFCFSLVVSCIRPVEAVTYTDSNPAFLLYGCVAPSDPVLMSDPVAVPCISNAPLFGGTSSGNFFFNFASSHFEPFGQQVTCYCVIGVSSPSGVLSSNQAYLWNTQFVVQQSHKGTDYFIGYKAFYRGQARQSDNCTYLALEFDLNPKTCAFYFDTSEWVFSPASGTKYAVFVDCAYLIYSTNHDVVSIVVDILDQVSSINGNTSSALSALNQILTQCQSIKADTASIITILNAVKSQLITLNGTVDDIYTLLKDSLATESAEVDKKSQELGNQIMQRVDSEQYWSDKNTENFEALDMGNWTFGDGVVGALPTVGNLFKSLWDSIGEATLIFVFPLMLGIALVIVGRISRTAGKGHKQGGGDDG